MKSNLEKYNEAWANLLIARRSEDMRLVHDTAEHLAHVARVRMLDSSEPDVGPCSHFMVANGHCINCHESVISR
jgi:hypothetical protein